MAPVVAFNKLMVSAPFEIPSSGRPRRSANKVDLPAPFGPTNPIRSPRLTWSDTSSKSARPAKDFESCETVSIAESAQCPLVRCPAQTVNHESRKGIFEIEGKAVRVAASEWSRVAARDIDGKTERSNGREPMSQSGSRTSFNQHEWLVAHLRFAGKAVQRYSLLHETSAGT